MGYSCRDVQRKDFTMWPRYSVAPKQSQEHGCTHSLCLVCVLSMGYFPPLHCCVCLWASIYEPVSAAMSQLQCLSRGTYTCSGVVNAMHCHQVLVPASPELLSYKPTLN